MAITFLFNFSFQIPAMKGICISAKLDFSQSPLYILDHFCILFPISPSRWGDLCRTLNTGFAFVAAQPLDVERVLNLWLLQYLPFFHLIKKHLPVNFVRVFSLYFLRHEFQIIYFRVCLTFAHF